MLGLDMRSYFVGLIVGAVLASLYIRLGIIG